MSYTMWVLMVIVLNSTAIDTQVIQSYPKYGECRTELSRGAEKAGKKLKEDESGFWIEEDVWATCVGVEKGYLI